jgi:hypothetical protein
VNDIARTVFASLEIITGLISMDLLAVRYSDRSCNTKLLRVEIKALQVRREH